MWCKWIDFHTLWLWHVPVLDRSLTYIIFMKMYLCACHYVPSVCMHYLAPGATTWQKLGSCHLTADMTCATGHFAELSRCDMTCDYNGSYLLLLSDVRAEETSGGHCGSAPWVEVATSLGIGRAATMGCDMPKGCHQPRKLCSCEAALKETAFIISLTYFYLELETQVQPTLHWCHHKHQQLLVFASAMQKGEASTGCPDVCSLALMRRNLPELLLNKWSHRSHVQSLLGPFW